ncbi:MAG: hypothetical protein IMZ62_07620 [Chloroflexi bacterium]|nr:hypothetical protein [Chloroflexota bacterium]
MKRRDEEQAYIDANAILQRQREEANMQHLSSIGTTCAWCAEKDARIAALTAENAELRAELKRAKGHGSPHDVEEFYPADEAEAERTGETE